MALLDPRLVARQKGITLEVVAYRSQAVGFDPRSGEGARRRGGRFNPPQSFPVLYLCLTRPCVVAEITRLAGRQGIDVVDLLPRELWRISGTLTNVLDLTAQATLGDLNLTAQDLVRDDYGLTQELGTAAHAHGIRAIRTPSATGVDHVLALLVDNLAGTVLAVDLLDTWTGAEDLDT